MFTNSLRCVATYPEAKVLSHIQMGAHVVQFMRTFYDIFPEFKTVDVSSSCYIFEFAINFTPDVSCRRELCWPIHSVHRYAL